MSEVKYVIEARTPQDTEKVEAISTKEKRQTESKKVKSNDEITTTESARSYNKTIGAIASVYGSSQLVIQPLIREQVNMATVSGDFVSAENIARTQSIVNSSVNYGLQALAIGGMIATGNIPMAIGTGVALASREISSAINRQQTNRAINSRNNIDNYINSYESARLINVKAGR